MSNWRRFGTAFVVSAVLLAAGCGQSAVERGYDTLKLEVVAGTRGLSPVGGALAVAPDGHAAAFVANPAFGRLHSPVVMASSRR